jgi:hypothetical protein
LALSVAAEKPIGLLAGSSAATNVGAARPSKTAKPNGGVILMPRLSIFCRKLHQLQPGHRNRCHD